VIERHREAVRVYADVHNAFEALDATIPHEHIPQEEGFWDLPSKQRQAWFAAAHARWEAKSKEAGRDVAYERFCEQGDLVAKITEEFAATPPTTMAGVAALLSYWSETMEEDSEHLDFHCTRDLLEGLSEALAGRA
jgi:hypothetical protein